MELIYPISATVWAKRPGSYHPIFPECLGILSSMSEGCLKGCDWFTARKTKFSIKDFFGKCDQIRRQLWIWLHLLKKSLTESFIFRAVIIATWKLVLYPPVTPLSINKISLQYHKANLAKACLTSFFPKDLRTVCKRHHISLPKEVGQSGLPANKGQNPIKFYQPVFYGQ